MFKSVEDRILFEDLNIEIVQEIQNVNEKLTSQKKRLTIFKSQ